jgi:hypothetical protein
MDGVSDRGQCFATIQMCDLHTKHTVRLLSPQLNNPMAHGG